MNFIKSTTRIVSRFGANNQQNSFVKGIIGSTRNSSFAYVNTIKEPAYGFLSLRIVQSRTFMTHTLTKNIYLVTSDEKKVKFDGKSMQIKDGPKKPMALIIGWLMAQPKHLNKIAKLYTSQGYDALVVRTFPLQLMFPMHKGQFVAQDILKFITNNTNYDRIILHGFSVAAYMWCEVMLQMVKNMDKYKPVVDRIEAQVWDSVVDTEGMPMGISRTLFPENKLLEWTTRNSLEAFMKLFHNIVVIRYNECHNIFYFNHLVRSPALFYVSKTDLVGTELVSSTISKLWKESGIKVTYKCWDESPHVSHFVKHQDEYLNLLMNHLKATNFLPHPEKLLQAGTRQTLGKQTK